MVDERKRLIPRQHDLQDEENVTFCCFPRIHNRKIAQAAVLSTVALERFSFYSLSGNLVLFLTVQPLNWESYNAVNASLYFLGISFITCLFGGWLADAFTGRFRAILLAFVVYLAGYVLLPLLSHFNNANLSDFTNGSSLICTIRNHTTNRPNLPDENCVWQVYITLTIIAVGTGVVKANLAPLGADQVRGESSNSSTAFFHWFYWSINVGTLVALTAITYVQQVDGFFYGYLAANICLAVALLIFFCGKCSYIIRKPVGNVFKNIYKIIREACRIRRRRRKTHDTTRINYSTIGGVDTGDHQEPTSFLDHAKFRYGGSFHDSSVENVKLLGKIVCVFLVLIPYWMVYFQIETTFLVQGLHMSLTFDSNAKMNVCGNNKPTSTGNSSYSGDGKFQIVAAWLSLFDVVLLVVLLPIMDRVVYPWISRRGYNFTMEKRIALGLVFSVLAVFSAGLVETFRLKILYKDENNNCCYTCLNQTIGRTTYYAADMSILWQIPQYTLIGLSEVFTSVAGLEFACSIAPQSLKSSVMGLFYLFSGLGSLISVGLIYALLDHWFFKDDWGNINCYCHYDDSGQRIYNECHLDYYFFTLGSIQILGIMAFLIVLCKCKLRKVISSISVQDPTLSVATRPNPLKADDEISTNTVTSEVGARPRIPVDLYRTISKDHSGRLNRLVPDEG